MQEIFQFLKTKSEQFFGIKQKMDIIFYKGSGIPWTQKEIDTIKDFTLNRPVTIFSKAELLIEDQESKLISHISSSQNSIGIRHGFIYVLPEIPENSIDFDLFIGDDSEEHD